MGLKSPEHYTTPLKRRLIRLLFEMRWAGQGCSLTGLVILIWFVIGIYAALQFGWWGAVLSTIPTGCLILVIRQYFRKK